MILPNAEERSDRLSLDDIVTAAVLLTRRIGLGNLTMRALADELGVTPMATYYYVKNKDELIALVEECVLATIPVPDAAEGTWDERLWQLNKNTRMTLAAHPGLADALITRPRPPSSIELAEVTVGFFREAGFDPIEAKLAYSAFAALMFGCLLTEADWDRQESGERFYRWAFDTLMGGFKARLARR